MFSSRFVLFPIAKTESNLSIVVGVVVVSAGVVFRINKTFVNRSYTFVRSFGFSHIWFVHSFVFQYFSFGEKHLSLHQINVTIHSSFLFKFCCCLSSVQPVAPSDQRTLERCNALELSYQTLDWSYIEKL